MAEVLSPQGQDEAEFYKAEHDSAVKEMGAAVVQLSEAPTSFVDSSGQEFKDPAHFEPIKRAADKRGANLWRAKQHYEGNKEDYQAAAIEDATAAGHDIDFGGRHYPKQQVSQSKEPEA